MAASTVPLSMRGSLMKRREALRNLTLGVAASVVGSPTQPALCGADSQASKLPARSVRFAHLTDVHVYAGRSSAKGLAKAIKQVHDLPDKPAFILNGGDAILDALE